MQRIIIENFSIQINQNNSFLLRKGEIYKEKGNFVNKDFI